MLKFQDYNYMLFGNPVNHSQSPKIHNLFAKQVGIFHAYKAVNIPINNFSLSVCQFFKTNGQGANITAPFKKDAYFFSNKLTKRAKIAESVNTLKKINNKCILGDNTDGIGLLSDLIRLNFIKKHDSILIIGAGGAAQGVIFPLLSFGCSIVILNRTILKSEKLVSRFNKYGQISIFTQDSLKEQYFDLIINATSKNVEQNNFLIPSFMFSNKTCFYDMNYHTGNTPFINWCITKANAKFFSNGIGMLVFQAAHSFLLWHNCLPEINSVIDILKKDNSFE